MQIIFPKATLEAILVPSLTLTYPKKRGIYAPVKYFFKRESIQISEHFNLTEFSKEEYLFIHPEVVEHLELLRALIGKPLMLNSGHRTPVYNKSVGGASLSMHIYGWAIDGKVPAAMSVDDLAVAAVKVGFTGIGRYYKQNFVHMDLGPKRSWSDRKP